MFMLSIVNRESAIVKRETSNVKGFAKRQPFFLISYLLLPTSVSTISIFHFYSRLTYIFLPTCILFPSGFGDLTLRNGIPVHAGLIIYPVFEFNGGIRKV